MLKTYEFFSIATIPYLYPFVRFSLIPLTYPYSSTEYEHLNGPIW